MPGAQLQTQGFILARQPSGSEKFEQLTVFSAEDGTLPCLRRMTQTKTSSAPLDLFDEVELWLESSNQGRSWFIKEHRLVHRHAGIGRSYDTLRAAAALATLIARNPVADESRPAVAALLRSSFEALAGGGRPDIAWLKALYRLLRDEGYPVKEQWWHELPEADRLAAIPLLNQPLSGQTADAATVARVVRRLEDWVRAETEIRFG